jgi:hypothetical protein
MKRLLCILVLLAVLLLPVPVSATSATLTARVASSDDNCVVYNSSTGWKITKAGVIAAGYYNVDYYSMSSGFRFSGITIPPGSTITQAYLTFTAYDEYNTNTVVNSIIQGEASVSPQPFSTYVDYISRSKLPQTVSWQNISAWSPGNTYRSPSVVYIVQDIVDQPGWSYNSSMVLFWGDLSNQSTNASYTSRRAYSYAQNASLAVSLTVAYETYITDSTLITSGISSDLTALKNSVASLQTVTTTDLSVLKSSTAVISSGLTAVQNSQQAVTTNLASVSKQSTTISEQVAKVATSVAGTQASMSILQNDISKMQTTNANLVTEVSTLSAETASLSKQVAELTVASTDLGGKLDSLQFLLYVLLVITGFVLIMLLTLLRRGSAPRYNTKI